MANFTTIGLEKLIDDIGDLANIPDSVIDGMLTAQADVIEPEQKRVTKAMWSGPYATGTTSDSIKRAKIKGGRDGKTISIAPHGRNSDGNSNAEVAFINEFGKHNQPARPAIDTANKNKAEQAVEAARKVYDAYVDSKNL